MTITLVACCDQEMGIADGEGNLLFNLPRDNKHFQTVTSGKIVVMGRKTWESLPRKPLPKRKNFVVTMNDDYVAEGATVLHSIEEVLELGKYNDIYIIGGSEIYYQTIDFADRLIITHVHITDYNAKLFFPDFGVQDWKLKHVTPNKADKKHKFSFTFATYERKHPKE